MCSMRVTRTNIIAAIALATIVSTFARTGDAATTSENATAAYKQHVADYQRRLSSFKQQQRSRAEVAAATLGEKLEVLHVKQVQEERYRQYRQAQIALAQAAAKRLADKLERLYGRRPKRIAIARPIVAVVVPAPAIAPRVHAMPHVVKKPHVRKPAIPVQASLPVAPVWYGWGKL
jgi:exonuclease VII large subunit